MYASTPMTRVATLDQSWRLAALRVLGVTFATFVLLVALMTAVMPRSAAAATLQAVPAVSYELPPSAAQDLVQPAGFFKKRGHYGKGHHVKKFGHFGKRGFYKKRHGFGGFHSHKGFRGGFRGHARFGKGIHGGHGKAFFGHGKRFYR